MTGLSASDLGLLAAWLAVLVPTVKYMIHQIRLEFKQDIHVLKISLKEDIYGIKIDVEVLKKMFVQFLENQKRNEK